MPDGSKPDFVNKVLIKGYLYISILNMTQTDESSDTRPSFVNGLVFGP